MQKMLNRNIKISLKIFTVVFGMLMLAVSSIGIYFALNPETKYPKEINPVGFSIDKWDGKTVDTTSNWLDSNNFANRGKKTFTINSAESFIYFINLVNNESTSKQYNYFNGYTIYLNCSVDLSGNEIDSIGVKVTDDNGQHSTFQGMFDGGYYTIFNGKIKGDGLFGYIENSTIKNKFIT